MPSLAAVLARFTKQTLVWYQRTGSNPSGKGVYATPVQLNCRWEDKPQEIITAEGRKVISRNYILIGTPLQPGDLVFLGTLADVMALPNYPDTPTMNQGVREILKLAVSPDINAISFIYEAYC